MELSLYSFFLYATLSLFILISYTLCKHFSYVSIPNLPPGRLGLPFIGETLGFISEGRKGRPEKFIYNRMARYSSRAFKTSLLGEPTIVLCGAVGNKFLFTNEMKLVTPWWPSTVNKIFPPQAVDESSVNEESKKVRRVIQNVIKPDSHNKFVSIMDSIAQRHFGSCWEHAKQVQVYQLAKRYTFWLACCLFMSISEPEEVAKLAGPFNFVASGVISIPINLPGTSFNRAIKASKIVQEQLLKIIKQRKVDLAENKASPTQDILSHMLLFTDENGKFMSENSIANKIMGLLIGGHDTTSAAITFIVKYLAELPHIYHEVFKEQMEILKRKAPGELLNWDDIQKMKYSWNVACEVLRLAPPLQGSFREALMDFHYAGYFIPKGWKLYWNTNSTHKYQEYFPEPEKFNPSRFNGNGPAPYTFVPFGGGPRMCPGKEYARLEMLVFMHNIVKRFKWEKVIPHEKIIYDPLPMPSNGLPIRLYPHTY